MKFLLLNQTFYPDVMATGQYLSELAVRLVERGHEVTVLTSRRAYDEPKKLFPRHENWRGIRIIRIGSTGFGKDAKWRRTADFASFTALCLLRLAFLRSPDAIVALTSPPLISFVAAWFARLRRARFFYWVMDFNPDEAIAAGWLQADSFAAKILEQMSRFSLRNATRVIALDRFMLDRITAKGISSEKITVVPPWANDRDIRFQLGGREAFRKAHGLQDKFVVMYSGNHSPCHPLDTLMIAAERLRHDSQIAFCFVGGGSEFKRVRACAEKGNYRQITCLPYLPWNQLSGSLSAADLHVVVMGAPFVGLVHPCKIYNLLSVGAPILYIGPNSSHITDISNCANGDLLCLASPHNDVDAVVQHIQKARASKPHSARGLPAKVLSLFSQEALVPKLIALLEES